MAPASELQKKKCIFGESHPYIGSAGRNSLGAVD
jgi:hypothetical protein